MHQNAIARHDQLRNQLHQGNHYSQWLDACPTCGRQALIVAQVKSHEGTVHPNTPLHLDGFEYRPEDGGPADTEDEKVLCTACRAEHELSDLTIE